MMVDPKEWEATEIEVWDISGADASEIRKIIASVARRRALAELRALQTDAYGLVGSVETWRITARIAAIEAEEA